MNTVDGRIEFARYAAGLNWSEIPIEAQVQARRTLLDTIGTALGGRRTEAAVIAAGSGGDPFATGGRRAFSGHESAGHGFALAVSASALDFDDGHYMAGAIHPASTVVSSLLVAAAGRDIPLDRLLTAQVAGYEVGLRLAHLLWPTDEEARWYCSGTAASVAAAVAVARLDSDDPELICRAMEIAWAHAPMAALQFPMVKEAIGWAASTALFAVDLARRGFKSYPQGSQPPADPDVFPPTPFDEPAAEGDTFIATIGERFESARTYLKPFSCCRYTHTSAAMLLDEIDSGLDPVEIHSVEVGTHRGAQFLNSQRPPTLEHAQYSFPFVLGAIAVHGHAGPDQISADRLRDPAILEFANRVEVAGNLDADAQFPRRYGAALTIRTKEGERRVERFIAPGDVEDPLSESTLVEKFTGMAGDDELPGLILEDSGLGTGRILDRIVEITGD